MASSIEYNKLNTVEKHKIQLLELKFRDLQSRLDLEISIKLRLEVILIKTLFFPDLCFHFFIKNSFLVNCYKTT